MKFKQIAVIVAISLILAGCNLPPPQPQMNPLQIQAMQTREFKTSKKQAFNAVMTVFQNMGYIIKSASLETGFITAQSPTSSSHPSFGAFAFDASLNAAAGIQTGPQAVTTQSTTATAFITSTANHEARVRLNFVSMNSRSSGYGQQSQNNQPVLKPQLYQNAFNQIQQEIFVSNSSN